jgi:hypothetical protein
MLDVVAPPRALRDRAPRAPLTQRAVAPASTAGMLVRWVGGGSWPGRSCARSCLRATRWLTRAATAAPVPRALVASRRATFASRSAASTTLPATPGSGASTPGGSAERHGRSHARWTRNAASASSACHWCNIVIAPVADTFVRTQPSLRSPAASRSSPTAATPRAAPRHATAAETPAHARRCPSAARRPVPCTRARRTPIASRGGRVDAGRTRTAGPTPAARPLASSPMATSTCRRPLCLRTTCPETTNSIRRAPETMLPTRVTRVVLWRSPADTHAASDPDRSHAGPPSYVPASGPSQSPQRAAGDGPAVVS